MARRREKTVACWGCGARFPRQKNPGGRKNQSRILVNCEDCRARRRRYQDRLYLERRRTAGRR